MRTENRKAKAMATVPIPDRLRAFLSEVRDLIGRGDEAAILPSDDLLQSDDAYGGLTNDGDYSFVFFPGAGNDQLAGLSRLGDKPGKLPDQVVDPLVRLLHGCDA